MSENTLCFDAKDFPHPLPQGTQVQSGIFVNKTSYAEVIEALQECLKQSRQKIKVTDMLPVSFSYMPISNIQKKVKVGLGKCASIQVCSFTINTSTGLVYAHPVLKKNFTDYRLPAIVICVMKGKDRTQLENALLKSFCYNKNCTTLLMSQTLLVKGRLGARLLKKAANPSAAQGAASNANCTDEDGTELVPPEYKWNKKVQTGRSGGSYIVKDNGKKLYLTKKDFVKIKPKIRIRSQDSDEA